MSSSSSVTPPSSNYEVFLSYRGQDTCNGFASHLYRALLDKGIKVFMDHEVHGEGIASVTLNQIEESRISVVVFSENYADSIWCLDKLVLLLQCQKRYGQVVIPVFYNIDPLDVRKQTGSFRNAFKKHESRFRKSLDVQPWSSALTEAANLPGYDLRHFK